MIPMKKEWLTRRTFLRCATGGLGTLVALPPLEAMFRSDSAFAQDAAGKPRFLAIYQPNGHHADRFQPKGGVRTPDFTGQTSAALQPWMEHVTLLTRMIGTQSESQGNAHLVAITSWLTGVPVPSEDALTHKVSADTHIAQHYEKTSPTGRSQHLVLSGSPFMDPGRMQYNNEQKDWISTAENGEKIFATISLEDVVSDLFKGVDPMVSDEHRQKRHAFRQSILDFAVEDIGRVEARLGAADKQVLGSYFENVRQMELRLQQPLPAPPSVDPSSIKLSRQWPKERKADEKNPYIDEHWKDTMQVLRVAFQADLVRSVAYMLETEAGESGYENHGLPDSHGTSHSVNEEYAQRDRVHSELFVEMLDLFKNTPVGDSNLLDQTMILWGTGIGVNHTADQQMAVLAGFKGNGLAHGAVRNFNNQTSAIPLMRTLMLHLGVLDANQGFGDAGPNDVIDLTS